MSLLSDRLRELRGTQSQAEMARLLGIQQPQWARYESGVSSPSVEMLEKICRAHACSADWLLGLNAQSSCRNDAIQSDWKSRALASEAKLHQVRAAIDLIQKGTTRLSDAIG